MLKCPHVSVGWLPPLLKRSSSAALLASLSLSLSIYALSLSLCSLSLSMLSLSLSLSLYALSLSLSMLCLYALSLSLSMLSLYALHPLSLYIYIYISISLSLLYISLSLLTSSLCLSLLTSSLSRFLLTSAPGSISFCERCRAAHKTRRHHVASCQQEWGKKKKQHTSGNALGPSTRICLGGTSTEQNWPWNRFNPIRQVLRKTRKRIRKTTQNVSEKC